MVTVHVFGQSLRQSVSEPQVECEVAGPVTVKALLEANPEKLTGMLAFAVRGELLVTINRKVGTLESMVKDGDTVKLTHQFNPSYDGARWHNP